MKKQNAGKYYNNLAAIYDTATINSWSAPEHVENVTQTIANKETTVLDIGIGTGQSIQQLHSLGQFKIIEGIDASDKMLALCRQKYPDITLHHGDFLSFNKFSLRNFDLIICCGALEFITDLNFFLRKCKSILSDNGNIVLTFEPRIAGHEIQSLPISKVESERSASIDNFFTFRHDIDEFVAIAENNNFQILKNKLFVSYKRLDTNIIYSLIHMTIKK